MRNAQYLRAQAEFCLQAARRISDHKTVANLKVDAARYHDEATEVEAVPHPRSKDEDATSLKRDRPADFDFRSGPRPSRMVDLLKALEEREPPESH